MITRRTMALGLAANAANRVGARAAAAPFAWPGGARAAVSLTYDDSLDSQLDHGIAQISASGFKATFFLTRENMDARLADWIAVSRLGGHEFGNHTVSHPCGLQPYTASSYARRELMPMQAYMDLHFGQNPKRVFAYPCSETDLGPGDANQKFHTFETTLKRVGLAAARTSDEDSPMTPAYARARPYWLRASATTYDVDDPGLAMRYVEGAMARGLWAILVFHDIVPTRTQAGETSMASHKLVLDWLKVKDVWCAPMGAVLDHIRAAPA
ncbi:MAG TPA: polysaccharide deacetylase family protein [Caulobacteraceae bacterium]|nr:polysaccharide deacetylase family protein [Caulobacteraceae bacterium]